MAKRNKSQTIGEIGEVFTCYQILKNRNWIARMQQHDYGIDLEAELVEEEVKGHIVKVQVKSSDDADYDENSVKISLKKEYVLRYDKYAIPVIFVVVDTKTDKEQAYYLFIQEWIHNNRDTLLSETAAFVTLHFPRTNTIGYGLNNEWKKIAKKETRFQYVKLLEEVENMMRKMRDPIASYFQELISDSVVSKQPEVAIQQVINKVLEIGLKIRGTSEGLEIADSLFNICRQFGEYFSKENIFKLCVREERYSRTGVTVLEILYDYYFGHVSSLDLPYAFSDYPELAYYCKLRERYAGIEGMSMIYGNKTETDWTMDGMGLSDKSLDELRHKYPNRGASAILDYLEYINKQS